MNEQKKIPHSPSISMKKDGRCQDRYHDQEKSRSLYNKDLETRKKYLEETKYKTQESEEFFSQLTLNQWFRIWIQEYKEEIVKNSTLLLYTSNYKRYVESAIGLVKLSQLRSLDFQKLYNNLRRQNLSSGTIRIVHSILFNLLNQAVKEEILVKNPTIGVVFPKGKKQCPRVLTKKEQYFFLESAKNSPYFPLYKLSLGTGMRIGELAGLIWDDINFETNALLVKQTLLYQANTQTGKYSFYLQSPKSSTSQRTIPLISDLVFLLKNWRDAQSNFYSAYPARIKSFVVDPTYSHELTTNDLVFTTRNGAPLQEPYLIKNLSRITKKMNEQEEILATKENRTPFFYKKITPHTLRHSFATRAFENGLAPKTVQELLGHSSLNLTMDLYTHVTEEMKIQEMEKISSLFQES